MSISTKLSDSQLVILSKAAQSENRCVHPVPNSLAVQGGALNQVLKSLLNRGLIAEALATVGEDIWRTDIDENRYKLVITDTGLAAIGIADETGPPGEAVDEKIQSAHGAEARRRGTVCELFLERLRQSDGASLEDLVAATGWQAHSVRGFISATLKKKLGLNVISERLDGVRRYRIAA